ncbi:hypothetical protein H310_10609 [Aphanomyces invadans]|uniref:Dynein light chain Tctex-type 1 n=1 Tax=Aphanomyces invadans TaxID=157072 RepID=A0A024TPN9_9STRA|nr:hypothetical protein H310_10609 [Aphanomyces invadans]ETV95949.1 hypothetical protein H310_10609 [Aphanomyces invadans]|eukprot:XP_008875260.1 hypothetical protein H310_10609 [Aphanomyces invadans]
MDTGDSEFSADDVVPISKNAIESTLKDTVYNRKKVNDWTNSLVAIVLSGLQNLNKPFKYAGVYAKPSPPRHDGFHGCVLSGPVTCLIMQKTGAGVTTAAACYWDPVVDGNCTVLWENSTIQCVVTVYGVAISPSVSKHGEH